MNYNKKVALLFSLMFYPVKSTIHVIGDSHARMYTVNSHLLSNPWYSPFRELKIYGLDGTTMHRIGRDKLNALSLEKYNIKKEDTIIFVFGEIDVRCHIGRIRDIQSRTLEDVINELTNNYLTFISQVHEAYPEVRIVISGVVPPSNSKYNPDFPFYGTLQDRVNIVRNLNSILQSQCTQVDAHYVDAYAPFCHADGSVNTRLGDGVHIWPAHNRHMLEQLRRILGL